MSLTLLFPHDEAGNFHGAGMGLGGFAQWRELFRILFAPKVKPAPVMWIRKFNGKDLRLSLCLQGNNDFLLKSNNEQGSRKLHIRVGVI